MAEQIRQPDVSQQANLDVLKFKDFSGGIVSDYVDIPDKFFETMHNCFIEYSTKRLKSRPGLNFLGGKLRSSNDPIVKLINQQDDQHLFAITESGRILIWNENKNSWDFIQHKHIRSIDLSNPRNIDVTVSTITIDGKIELTNEAPLVLSNKSDGLTNQVTLDDDYNSNTDRFIGQKFYRGNARVDDTMYFCVNGNPHVVGNDDRMLFYRMTINNEGKLGAAQKINAATIFSDAFIASDDNISRNGWLFHIVNIMSNPMHLRDPDNPAHKNFFVVLSGRLSESIISINNNITKAEVYRFYEVTPHRDGTFTVRNIHEEASGLTEPNSSWLYGRFLMDKRARPGEVLIPFLNQNGFFYISPYLTQRSIFFNSLIDNITGEAANFFNFNISYVDRDGRITSRGRTTPGGLYRISSPILLRLDNSENNFENFGQINQEFLYAIKRYRQLSEFRRYENLLEKYDVSTTSIIPEFSETTGNDVVLPIVPTGTNNDKVHPSTVNPYYSPFPILTDNDDQFGYIPFIENFASSTLAAMKLLPFKIIKEETIATEFSEVPDPPRRSLLTFTERTIDLPSKNISSFAQQNHVYMASEAGAPVIKLYRENTSSRFVFYNAGLPRLNVGGFNIQGNPNNPPRILNKNPLNIMKDDNDQYVTPRGKYLFAFVLRHEYKVNNETFLREGPVFISDQIELEEPQLNPVSIDLRLPPIEAPRSSASQNSDIKYSPDIKVDVYRTKKNGNTFFKLTDDSIVNSSASGNILNLKTQWDFNTSDDELSSRGLYINGGEQDKDPPPSDAKYCYQIGNVAYYANNNKLFQAIPGEPEAVPEDNFVEFDAFIQGLSGVRRRLIIFTEKQVYSNETVINRLGEGNINPEIIHETAGCISNRAAVNVEDFCIWFGISGLYYTDGYRVRKISDHINIFYEKHIFDMPIELKRRIEGTYDNINRRIIWSIPYYDSNRSNIPQTQQLPFRDKPYHLILDLKFSNLQSGMGVFNIWSGGNVYNPKAMASYKNEPIMGTDESYVLRFNKNEINDPSIDFADNVDNAGEVRLPQLNNVYKQPILWHLRSTVFDLQVPINKNIKQWFTTFNSITSLLFKVIIKTDRERSDSGPVAWNDTLVWNQNNFNWGDNQFFWDKTPIIDIKNRVEPLDRAIFAQATITNELTIDELAEAEQNFDGTLVTEADLSNENKLSVGDTSHIDFVFDRVSGENLLYLEIDEPLFSDDLVGLPSKPDIIFLPIGDEWDWIKPGDLWTFNVSDDRMRLYLNFSIKINIDRIGLLGQKTIHTLTKWRLLGVPRNQVLHLLSFGYKIQGQSVTITTPAVSSGSGFLT